MAAGRARGPRADAGRRTAHARADRDDGARAAPSEMGDTARPALNPRAQRGRTRSRGLGDREPRRTDLTTIHVKDRQTVEPPNPRSSVDVPPIRTPANASSCRVSVHKGPQATDRPALMLANRLGRAKEAEERYIHRARVTSLKHRNRFRPHEVRNVRMHDTHVAVRGLDGDRDGHGGERSTPAATLTFGNVS